jgi:hypothetical protein
LLNKKTLDTLSKKKVSVMQLQKTESLSQQSYEYWIKKNWYYHDWLSRFYQWLIPKNSTVLQIGCKTTRLLDAVSPSYAIGIENDLHTATVPARTFDYVILSSVCMESDDIQELLQSLHQFCHSRTRIIIDIYSFWWEPILKIAQFLGLRRPTEFKNWVSIDDMNNFLALSNFEVITCGNNFLLPMYIPLLSWFINTWFAPLPIINRLCLINWFIARPKPTRRQEYSVSIIVPCKNERGNIEPIVQRCPSLGTNTELIFVEGNSSDGTFAQIESVIQKYPTKNIRMYKQEDKGKGDAVRTGFAHASGDILMIFDGDWTIPAHELKKFYDALATGLCDFANGSRLVYDMETDAMRWLNLIANYFFGITFSWILGQRIKDTLCGTKVLFKKDYALIAQNRHYFGEFDPFGDFDLLFGAAKLHLKIMDIPVHYKARTYGSTQIRRFYHGWLLLFMSWFGLKKFKCHG